MESMKRPSVPLSSTQSRKRRKIGIACRKCRDSKVRCDGGRPICSGCMKRGFTVPCTYQRIHSETFSSAYGISQASPDQSGQRYAIVRLKFAFSLTDKILGGNSIATRRTLSPSTHRNCISNDLQHNSQRVLSNDHNDVNQIDGLATVSTIEEDDCLYGGSSTIAFVRQVTGRNSAADPKKSDLTNSHPKSYANLLPTIRPTSPISEAMLERKERASVFPTRRKADDFLRCFWEFVHPVFPIVHKTTFIPKYQRLWLSDDSVPSRDSVDETETEETIFISTLNLMFALGCKFSEFVLSNQKASTANEFYRRSRHVFPFDILDAMSISLVQMLLLNGVYLQSTSSAERCWNTVGLAIRVAQSLGLHLESPNPRMGSQLECQMKFRIWHVCVHLDRLLAMTFGRPTMISKSCHVPVPLLIDDEYLSDQGEGFQPEGLPSRLGLFVFSCKLFEILYDVLSKFYVEDYGTNPSGRWNNNSSQHFMVLDALEFERRLGEFSDSVPEYLRAEKTSYVILSEGNDCVQLQQQVLYCRFLYTRLLSLRPLLLLATKRERQDPMQQPITPNSNGSLDGDLIKRCCNMCLSTAHSLIETIHQHLDTAYKSFGWHSCYFTFASATIVLAALKCPDIDVELNGTSFEECWTQCLAIFNHYKSQIHSASRAIQVLEALKAQIHTAPSQNLTPSIDTNSNDSIPCETSSSFPPDVFSSSTQLDFSQYNPYGTDCISDAWFGQHIVNLDWLNLQP